MCDWIVSFPFTVEIAILPVRVMAQDEKIPPAFQDGSGGKVAVAGLLNNEARNCGTDFSGFHAFLIRSSFSFCRHAFRL